jgi:hypothetical protein
VTASVTSQSTILGHGAGRRLSGWKPIPRPG